MEIPLSDDDIKKFIPNVIVYSELKDFSPKTLFSSLPIIILYETSPNNGHWTLLHETVEGIEFFDSYGGLPDEELKFIHNNQPHGSKLLNLLRVLTSASTLILLPSSDIFCRNYCLSLRLSRNLRFDYYM